MHRSSSTARALVRLVCVLLLFAQHAGLSHAVWHAAHELAGGIETHSDAEHGSGSPEASTQCALDAALGQVLGAAPQAAPVFHLETADAHTAPTIAVFFAALHSPTPRSRGPPALP